MRRKTDIERIVSTTLSELKLIYKREVKFDFYHVDFFISEFRLSIQCDGRYWHGGCKKCSKTAELSSKQKRQKRRDLACVAYHRHQKLNLLRLCECTIKNKRALIYVILKVIEEINNGKHILIY